MDKSSSIYKKNQFFLKANGAAYCETLGKNAYFQGEAGLWMDQFVPSISSSFASDTSPIAQEINQLNLSNFCNSG